MSRSGLSEDCDYDGAEWAHIRWRGQVASVIRGRRGQAFLRELADALDAMPVKRLIAKEFWNGEACALGVLGERRGVDGITVDTEDYRLLAKQFGIGHQLIQEIEWMNDEGVSAWYETPEQRWMRIRAWIGGLIKEPT